MLLFLTRGHLTSAVGASILDGVDDTTYTTENDHGIENVKGLSILVAKQVPRKPTSLASVLKYMNRRLLGASALANSGAFIVYLRRTR